MKNLIFWTSTILIFVFWPFSFVLSNRSDSVIFILAALVLLVDRFLYLRKYQYHYFTYLVLPLLHPAYLFFPIVAILFYWSDIKKMSLVIYAVFLIFISLFSWQSFYAYSIFTPDPLAFDTLNKKISLIPNRNLARIFHNKTDLFQDKFKSNVLTSLDPNNYFFALHPREIFENQNLHKFPFLAIVLFLIGLYLLIKSQDRLWIVSTLLAGIFSIALINNQDKFDLILYLPIALICLIGLRKIFTLCQAYYLIFSFLFLPLSIIELARIIFR
ncbi:hypothetical protein A3K29_02910 [Candidatus Collierbacteria bacterium RIFOXYB2_FULL_46_14]|uniref:Glycosyltransferase RgtA/B/C/D-like domain-containing protein n=1 Tax=Candidatus Collierbacteria bacterium GW2011_GWA2_46_26 TaxID=1618381 RepID=A0A0G1PM90_9BACT|nr:MAG: hypothetical protein UW29_C0004G0088 [Candidatus Collierbacteria bacterium GW2011_GWC2_44_13]KKU33861.1 MAG: hypothetical protein UX47_C0001G0144 [Candidatus Collierbacteria bacterium GW2011_GWA2_46_26]OGD73070.1 MAG: hypothetical protein A3K29_02910 [Candidatus Collierbacteria bacterium RIFOXYB2_FULL_46_14]OGD76112.1 MAG: hypothetical protein A3K43_02910 [Candidatus Collierbacteria bacterium RIFOXYA2_FULL_46_20]OGD77448.1 MAG: hypothetical protein A3K39_02910 [Candidatus Collierbacteri